MLLARQLSWAFCGLLIYATSAEVTYAQGGGGRGGFGGNQSRTRFELATLPEVQADLKLNDEQKKLATDQLAKMREKRAEMFQAGGGGGGGNQSARREAMAGFQDMSQEQRSETMAKLTATESKSLMGLLSEAQVKKLESIKGAALTIDQALLRPARRAQ